MADRERFPGLGFGGSRAQGRREEKEREAARRLHLSTRGGPQRGGARGGHGGEQPWRQCQELCATVEKEGRERLAGGAHTQIFEHILFLFLFKSPAAPC